MEVVRASGYVRSDGDETSTGSLRRLASQASTESRPAPDSKNSAPHAPSRKSSRAWPQPICEGRLTGKAGDQELDDHRGADERG